MDIMLLAERAKNFNANLKLYQAMAVQNSEKELVDMNRKQLLSSIDSMGRPLINKKTKSKYLSPSYSKKTGKSTPNIKLSGDTQREMFLETNENAGTYFMGSFNFKTPFLEMNYDNLFGISDKKKASIKPSKEFLEIYINKVWKS